MDWLPAWIQLLVGMITTGLGWRADLYGSGVLREIVPLGDRRGRL